MLYFPVRITTSGTLVIIKIKDQKETDTSQNNAGSKN